MQNKLGIKVEEESSWGGNELHITMQGEKRKIGSWCCSERGESEGNRSISHLFPGLAWPRTESIMQKVAIKGCSVLIMARKAKQLWVQHVSFCLG